MAAADVVFCSCWLKVLCIAADDTDSRALQLMIQIHVHGSC